MPTAEGTFPKVATDPLYASEVNRFARAGGIIAFKNSFFDVASGTAFQNVGSIVISPGSLTNPCILKVDYFTEVPPAGTLSCRLRLSGGIYGNNAVLGSLVSAGGGVPGAHFNTLFLGPTTNFYHTYATNSDPSLREYYGHDLTTTYPNSGLVIFFDVVNSTGDSLSLDKAYVSLVRSTF